jgi:hypothetical protein
MSLVPLVQQYANAPASLRSSGVAVISIERVVAQAKFRIATKRRKAMSRRDRVGGPTGVIRPFTPIGDFGLFYRLAGKIVSRILGLLQQYRPNPVCD